MMRPPLTSGVTPVLRRTSSRWIHSVARSWWAMPLGWSEASGQVRVDALGADERGGIVDSALRMLGEPTQPRSAQDATDGRNMSASQ